MNQLSKKLLLSLGVLTLATSITPNATLHAPTKTPITAEAKTGTLHYVKSADGELNMRSSASATSSRVATLMNGASFVEKSSKKVGTNTWLYGNSGRYTGWVNAKYLTTTAPTTKGVKYYNKKEKTTVYKSAKTTSAKVMTLDYKQAFRVIKTSSIGGVEWGYGEAVEKSGWVKMSDLSKTRPTASKPKPTTPKPTVSYSSIPSMKNLMSVTNISGQGLQGFTYGSGNDVYVAYATGDRTTYGKIRHYSSTGKLLKTSPTITFGHAQGISYHGGYVYTLADTDGVKTNADTSKGFKIHKRDPSQNFKAVKTYTLPADMRTHVLYVHDKNTISIARKYSNGNGGYKISKLKLNHSTGKASELQSWKLDGAIIGNRPNKALQFMTYHNGEYYIQTDGYYTKYNPKTNHRTVVNQKTSRESEGIGFNKQGKLTIAYNFPNQLLIQK